MIFNYYYSQNQLLKLIFRLLNVQQHSWSDVLKKKKN